jgi:hypothetical protein
MLNRELLALRILEPGIGSSCPGLESANYFDPSAASAAVSNA